MLKVFSRHIFFRLFPKVTTCSFHSPFEMSLVSDVKQAVEISKDEKAVENLVSTKLEEGNYDPVIPNISSDLYLDQNVVESASSKSSDEHLGDQVESCSDFIDRSNCRKSLVDGNDLDIPAKDGKSKNMIKKEKRREAARMKRMMEREHPDAVGGDKRKSNYHENDENSLKRAKLEKKAKHQEVTEQLYAETSYYFENGLRKVYPYYFTFTTHAKGRWIGKKIFDVFAKEFRALPAEEFDRCIKEGSITVNSKKVDTDFVLSHNDVLANVVHRHEVPVTDAHISIVHIGTKSFC